MAGRDDVLLAALLAGVLPAAFLAGGALLAAFFESALLAAAAFFIGALAAFFTAAFLADADLAGALLAALLAAAVLLATGLADAALTLTLFVPPERVLFPAFSGMACLPLAAVLPFCPVARAVLRVDFAISVSPLWLGGRVL
ncbi:hypothetical protein [Oleiagrimonas sp. C23AA]|uniref:hypothetical protein n=1 Tax=Oleiagrimonas sp. C23AA TaxID=2719047 RepID=UPI00141F852E|nr:hypothetical protein [Oleiagrimonas sp. C23AA]NII10219.1 hypothetical protein [Oleiagrimonas sp. C23AA]